MAGENCAYSHFFDLFEFIGARRKLSLQDTSIKISRVVDDVAVSGEERSQTLPVDQSPSRKSQRVFFSSLRFH